MSDENKNKPVGAAALSDPSKVKQVTGGSSSPAPDSSLMNRSAPGQAMPSAPETQPNEPKPDVPPDLSKLPTGDDGEPRDLDMTELQSLKGAVITALKSVYDPEIPVNIFDLGMIYKTSVAPNGVVDIDMTLTSPACPVAGTLPGEVEEKIRELPVVTKANVKLVWDPPWNKSMMSEGAKLELNII